MAKVNASIVALSTKKFGFPTLNEVHHHLALQRQSSEWPWIFLLLALLLATLIATAVYYG
jgi:hypothetical protein